MRDPHDAWGPVSALMSSARYSVSYFDTLVKALRLVIRDECWRDFILPPDRRHTFDRFADFLEYAGTTSDELLAVLRTRGEDDLAGQVLGLVTEPSRPHGGDGGFQPCNTRFEQDATYVVARLKRDDPDLAAQVIEGTISPHKAAIQAGIRKPRASIRTDNPAAAVRGLLKFFTAEQLLEAITAAKGTP